MLEAIRQDWRSWEQAEHQYAWQEGKDPPHTAVIFLSWLWSYVKSSVLDLTCRWKGHDVECVDSWCTPDTGGEAHGCRRCGQEWRHTYY